MSLPTPDGSTAVLTRPVNHPEFDTGHGRVAHIIRPSGKGTGHALVTESRVLGTELEALCGHRFVAQHDAKPLPKCQACVDLFRDRFGDDPDDVTDA